MRQLLTPAQLTVQTETRLNNVDMGLQQMASLVAVCLTHEREGFTQPLSLNSLLTMSQLQERLLPVLSPAVASRVRWLDDPENPNQPINCNPALIAIAVRNLIENACRYDTTGNTVDVTLASHHPTAPHTGPATVSMAVLDQGPGLEPSQVVHLFEPFIRGPGNAPVGTPAEAVADPLPQGLGLGLYIVQRIAGMHGAQVNWAPRDGGGSIFTLTLVPDERK